MDLYGISFVLRPADAVFPAQVPRQTESQFVLFCPGTSKWTLIQKICSIESMTRLDELYPGFTKFLMSHGGDMIMYDYDPSRRRRHQWDVWGADGYGGEGGVKDLVWEAIRIATPGHYEWIKLERSFERTGGMNAYLRWLRNQLPEPLAL